MKILIVEDDVHLAAVLKRGLGQEGYGVEIATHGQQAVAIAEGEEIDAVILDVMLPGRLDGFEVCGELRRRRVRTPILMLTALDSVEERVRGLDAGADDYLIKPFALVELLARLRSLTRRHREDRTAVLRAGTLELDTQARQAFVGSEPVPMTMKELAILEFFMMHPGQLLSTAQIEENVWSYDYLGETNVVKVYVARIRRKLMERGLHDPIETVRGGGYRFVPGRLSSDSSASPAFG